MCVYAYACVCHVRRRLAAARRMHKMRGETWMQTSRWREVRQHCLHTVSAAVNVSVLKGFYCPIDMNKHHHEAPHTRNTWWLLRCLCTVNSCVCAHNVQDISSFSHSLFLLLYFECIFAALESFDVLYSLCIFHRFWFLVHSILYSLHCEQNVYSARCYLLRVLPPLYSHTHARQTYRNRAHTHTRSNTFTHRQRIVWNEKEKKFEWKRKVNATTNYGVTFQARVTLHNKWIWYWSDSRCRISK